MPKAEDYGVEDVLDVLQQTFSLTGSQRGDEYKIYCPNPNHNEQHPSADVNLDTGYWHCFSCGVGGDLVDLGAMLTGEPKVAVMKMLAPQTEESLRVRLQRKMGRLDEVQKVKKADVKLPRPEDYEPGPLGYLRARGFTQDTLRRWGIRYAHEQVLKGKENDFTIKHSIAIPVRDERGRLLAWSYRRTDDSPPWQPKYINTPDVDVSELWFGLDHHAHQRSIVIVEGQLDAMWMDQQGFPALGMLGASMGERKILWLQRYTSGVTLFADKDDAGARWVERIGNVLGTRVPLRVVRYASWMPGKDPQDMIPFDVELAIERAIPWARFRASVNLGRRVG